MSFACVWKFTFSCFRRKMRISAAPIAQIPNAYLDGNLSSGDESDNDDLEKDYYSDSTISDDSKIKLAIG